MVSGKIPGRSPGFVQMWNSGNERDREHLADMHQYYDTQLRAVAAAGQSAGVAAAIHEIVDNGVAETLKTPNGQRVRCTKGCSGCCHLHVHVTREEAALLHAVVQDKGLTLDLHKLRRQSRHGLKTWNTQTPEDQRCVFLDRAGACTVYEARPVSCRKYLVVSKPKYCDTVRNPGHRVQILAVPDAEAITNAALDIFEYGSLPSMMLEGMP